MGDQDGRHAALARQFDHEIHHRLLGRHVEPGGGLVGDQELRPAGERERDDDALAHAAGKFERIGVVALARPRDPDLLEGFDRLFGGIVGCRLHMPHQYVRDLPADLADGIEGGARVLEDHRHFAAAQVAHGLFGRVMDIETGEADGALSDAAGAIEDAHHRIGGHRLARAGFADDRQRLALGQREVDMLDGAHGAAAGVEFDGEVADVEEGDRRGGHGEAFPQCPIIPQGSRMWHCASSPSPHWGEGRGEGGRSQLDARTSHRVGGAWDDGVHDRIAGAPSPQPSPRWGEGAGCGEWRSVEMRPSHHLTSAAAGRRCRAGRRPGG